MRARYIDRFRMLEGPPSWREVLALFSATLLITFLLVRLESAVGWLSGYSILLVAATFVYLPLKLLRHRGEDPADLGIHDTERGRAWRWALLIMLLTFPPYLIGFHGWQRIWLERAPTYEVERLARWPYEMEGRPPGIVAPGEAQLYTYKSGLRLRWRVEPGEAFEARLSGDGLRVLEARGARALATDEGVRLVGGSRGVMDFEADGRLTLRLKEGRAPFEPHQLRLGRQRIPAEAQPYQADRGWMWLLNLILTQIILVALPEEIFYRGYLQSRLDTLIGRDRAILGVQVNVASVLITSALFAIGHVVTIPHPQRLAVFFPSVLFGWMRRASGGVLAPALYHAACNILVEVAARFYF